MQDQTLLSDTHDSTAANLTNFEASSKSLKANSQSRQFGREVTNENIQKLIVSSLFHSSLTIFRHLRKPWALLKSPARSWTAISNLTRCTKLKPSLLCSRSSLSSSYHLQCQKRKWNLSPHNFSKDSLNSKQKRDLRAQNPNSCLSMPRRATRAWELLNLSLGSKLTTSPKVNAPPRLKKRHVLSS